MPSRAITFIWTAALVLAWGAPAAGAELPVTTPTSIGLFYQPGAPETSSLWRDGDSGTRLELRGRVMSSRGQPVRDALVELWHADATGSVDEGRYRAALRTDRAGRFLIRTVYPGHIEMARNNPVFAPRHVHIVVTHPDHPRLISLIYFKGDERLEGAAYPELAIPVEESRQGDITVLFATAQIVLQ